MKDMQSAVSTSSSELTEVSAMSPAQLLTVVQSQAERITALERQVEWFQRQHFGQKSERFVPEPNPNQLHLGETFPVPASPVEERKSIPAHTRRVKQHDGAETAGSRANHHADA